MQLLEIRLISVRTTGLETSLKSVSISPGQIKKEVELEDTDNTDIQSLRIKTTASVFLHLSDSNKGHKKKASVSVIYRVQLADNTQISEPLLKGTAIFMAWPYVRAMINSIFAEAHIIIPPLPALDMKPLSQPKQP